MKKLRTQIGHLADSESKVSKTSSRNLKLPSAIHSPPAERPQDVERFRSSKPRKRSLLEGPHSAEILKPTSRKKRKKSNIAVVTNVADKAGEVLYKNARTKKKTKNLKRFRPPFVVREEVAIGWAERLVIAIQHIGKRNPVLLLKTLQKFMYLIGFTIVLLIVCLFFVFKDKGGQILNYMSDKNHQHSEASRVVVDSSQK